MTERVEKLYHYIRDTKMEICTAKAHLFTEAYKKYDGDPDIVRTAKAQAYMLENIPIFIMDGDLIAGAPASKPVGLEADFWTRGCWRPEGVASIRAAGSHIITDETAEDMKQLSDYWQHFTTEYKMLDMFDDKMWAWKKSGYHLPRNKTIEEAAGSGLALSSLDIFPEQEFCSVNYEYILNSGLNKQIAKAKKELENIDCWELKTEYDIERVYALRAMVIIDEAVIKWANRYAVLAEEKAAACADPIRKKELLDMADTCRRVPAEPCKTFLDTVHFQWFIYILCHYMNVMAIGRVDQYMYPFYKHDIEAGLITEEQVLEILQCFRLKYLQIRSTSGGQHRAKWSGQASWRGITLGGVKPDGTDATNELTYLFLEAAMQCRTPHHTISLRVHPGTPDKLMKKAIELTKTGIGMPSYVSDTSYIATLVSKGVPLEKARDYFIVGCLDVTVPEGWGQVFSMCDTALPFDTFLHNGYSPTEDHYVGPKTGDPRDMKTFDEFMDKLMEHYTWYFKCYAADRMIRFKIRQAEKFLQDALMMSMWSDGPEVGCSPFYRKMPYPGLGPGMGLGVGTVNVGNSLYSIKKLVYDEKKFTMDELINALDANWEGERNQEIRKMCMELPKFGNNIDEVDQCTSGFYNRMADIVNDMDNYRGTKYCASAISITSHEPGGKLVGATPDGRMAGKILADGCCSPAQGTDKKGITAVINSALKIPQVKYNSMLFNQKLHPTTLQTEEDIMKLAELLHVYLDNGGKQIQFNVVSQEKLIAAHEHPEEYQDLIVRVAGYSTYFTLLSDNVQKEIIARTNQEAL